MYIYLCVVRSDVCCNHVVLSTPHSRRDSVVPKRLKFLGEDRLLAFELVHYVKKWSFGQENMKLWSGSPQQQTSPNA